MTDRRGSGGSATPIVPRRVLFGNPQRVSPRISPDGSRLAWVAPDEGVLNVWVTSIGPEGPDLGAAHPVTADRERGIRAYAWAHDGRHLLYQQDRGGDENWHLHSVDLLTGMERDLTPFDGVSARIEALHRHHPDTVLLGINRENPQLHDVYRVSLATGALEKVLENPGYIGFVADNDLSIRAGLAPTPDGGMVIEVRDEGEAGFRPLMSVGHADALSTAPLAISADGSTLYVITSLGANAAALVAVDCGSGAMTTLAADPIYDVAAARLHPDTNHPQVVAFGAERIRYEVLDPVLADDMAGVLAADAGDVSLLGADDADQVWLVGYIADDGPVRYYRWDRSQGRATFLFDHQPQLSQYPLSPMEPFSFTSRDGLAIHGYATFPPELPRAGLPTVLNVHGGPWARDAWGFDPEAQWLANRGYLCLQVNFRGSTGYGKDFLNAGDRQWGAAMHDDLLDAVNEAVAQGWTDPTRVAIYGGSYGGYAALVGATCSPDVFACAVDIVGPSNLATLIESIPAYWEPLKVQFHTRVGNPETEPEFLWSRSPLSRAATLSIPLLIAQGANDPRVKQAESEQFVAALVEGGIDHEYLLFADEGHGFAKPENRLRFYAAAEAFLARHLGGRCEQPDGSQPETGGSH
ncbi:MAG: S9 family peptidase [Acidimicrobiales bacterium]